MQDEDPLPVIAVENPARQLDDLAMARTGELPKAAAAARMFGQLPYVD
jgi:hypothetical protein